jgi:hypothetical protein
MAGGNPKSATALRANTALPAEAAIGAVRRATELRGEGGLGKVGGKWQKGSLKVLIDSEEGTSMMLKVAMDQAQRGNLSFAASADGAETGSELRVGPLIHYQSMQSKLLGFIPIGPASIIHFGFYQSFLERVREELLGEDPGAEITIGIPET